MCRPRSGSNADRGIRAAVCRRHPCLLYGGIFLYPEDAKDPDRTQGKLRLVYEAAPLAFVVENAGGRATTGTTPILDLTPESLHQRTPLVIGSRLDVEDYETFCRGEGGE